MSGAALARRLGKSEKYARNRLDGTFEFTLNDIENFCLYIRVNPEEFIGKIERDGGMDLPETPKPDLPIKPLGEVLNLPRRNVSGYLDDAIHNQGLDTAAGTDETQAEDD